MVIYPSCEGGVWAFDDASCGLVREPFVGAINTMIDALVVDIPDAKSGITMIFGAEKFPGAQIGLEKLREEFGGNWYAVSECEAVPTMVGIEGWLCPALFHYFPEAPRNIFVKIEQKK